MSRNIITGGIVLASSFDAISELHTKSFNKEYAESAVWAALYHLAIRLDRMTESVYEEKDDDKETS